MTREIDAAMVAAAITAGDAQAENAAPRTSAERRSPWDGLNNFELWSRGDETQARGRFARDRRRGDRARRRTIRVRIGDRELAAEFTRDADGGGILAIDGRRYPVFGARRKDSILVSVGPASFEFMPAEAAARRRARGLAAAEITRADARQGAEGAGARRRPGRGGTAAGRDRSDEDGNDARRRERRDRETCSRRGRADRRSRRGADRA